MSQTRLSEPIRRSGRASKFSSATSSRSEKTPRPSAILVSSCGHHGERLEQPPKKKKQSRRKSEAEGNVQGESTSFTFAEVTHPESDPCFSVYLFSFIFCFSFATSYFCSRLPYIFTGDREKAKKNITKSSNKWHTRTVQRPV